VWGNLGTWDDEKEAVGASVGLIYHNVRELLTAQRGNAPFNSIVTIGRQQLFLRPAEVAALKHEFGLGNALTAPPFGAYADDFLRATLDTDELYALDASDYEGATLIHDLNVPVPTKLECRFDAVIDAGSLEHVFAAPIALASYMRMLKPLGRLFIATTANNLCGHGFYQFSPELMFRALDAAHGFRIDRLLLLEARYPSIELAPTKRVVEVTDPAALRQRIGLVSRRPVLLLVHAQKLHHLPDPFAVSPQQSDYTVQWQRPANRVPDEQAAFIRHYQGLRQRLRFSWLNRRFYRRVD
jgi:SAM-dependent methyltransferase